MLAARASSFDGKWKEPRQQQQSSEFTPRKKEILVTCSCNATLKTIQSLITRVIKNHVPWDTSLLNFDPSFLRLASAMTNSQSWATWMKSSRKSTNSMPTSESLMAKSKRLKTGFQQDVKEWTIFWTLITPFQPKTESYRPWNFK